MALASRLRTRGRRLSRLQQIIEEQQAQIDRLLEKLAAYEAAKPVKRAAPAIR
jgi:hypothetical protein